MSLSPRSDGISMKKSKSLRWLSGFTKKKDAPKAVRWNTGGEPRRKFTNAN